MAVDLGFPKVKGSTVKGVAYVREELVKFFAKYMRIRDALDGEDAIKAATETYLPMPNSADRGKANRERYEAYILRAIFYNVTKRTLEGLIGLVFLRKPTVTLPTVLEPLLDDASGDNQTLEQVTATACNYALAFGRMGLFVDYPATDDPATVADLASGNIRPTIKTFVPWHVPNWRSVYINSEEVLTLVVLYEGFEIDDDGFERKFEPQYRVLRLVENVYTIEVWTKASGAASYSLSQSYTPTDSNGTPFDRLPFMFVGAMNNNSAIDMPPMEALATLNIAHYRNSADYEESVYLTGQPTPVFAGLTKEWVDDVMGGSVLLGTRGAVMLPVGGSAELLQAEPNSLVKDAMEAKERQMVALGAKLVQQREVQRTATESSQENAAENSVLANVAKNVAAGMLWALKWASAYTGADAAKVVYELSTEYDLAQLTPADRAQLVKEWQAGAIAWPELRSALRKAGIASLSDEDAAKAIQDELAASLAAVNPLSFDTSAKPATPTGEPGGGAKPNDPGGGGGTPAKPLPINPKPTPQALPGGQTVK